MRDFQERTDAYSLCFALSNTYQVPQYDLRHGTLSGTGNHDIKALDLEPLLNLGHLLIKSQSNRTQLVQSSAADSPSLHHNSSLCLLLIKQHNSTTTWVQPRVANPTSLPFSWIMTFRCQSNTSDQQAEIRYTNLISGIIHIYRSPQCGVIFSSASHQPAYPIRAPKATFSREWSINIQLPLLCNAIDATTKYQKQFLPYMLPKWYAFRAGK